MFIDFTKSMNIAEFGAENSNTDKMRNCLPQKFAIPEQKKSHWNLYSNHNRQNSLQWLKSSNFS